MGTSVFDSDLLKDAWSTEEMCAVFNDAARMRRRLDVEAAMKGLETDLRFRQALPENTVIRNALSDAKLDRLPDPTRYVGAAPEIVDQMIAAVRQGGRVARDDTDTA